MSSFDPSTSFSTIDADAVRVPASVTFDNSYARLPESFYARLNPTPVAAPRLIKLNIALARALGLDANMLARLEGVEMLAGNRMMPGAEPLAMAYAGHQFGSFVPRLGDGRANLLGEVVGRDGVRRDLQLKGSGPTPFSRRGDGRAALGPVLREYILSEAMAALGVPTTRALAAVATGEPVYRETAVPGAIFVRVAASHLRVGTFQYFLAQGDFEGLRILADYTISRHYPQARKAKHPYRALLSGVIARQAALLAQWMLIGFIHGVMNTDNMSISGETIDYGPCAFMEAFDPQQVFSSIDRQGRYAYRNQPTAAHWNLTRLAETLLPLLDHEAGGKDAAMAWAHEELAAFGTLFERAYLNGFRRKLGLVEERPADALLVQDLLDLMHANEADFTLTFRNLGDAAAGPHADAAVRSLFHDSAAFDLWALRWRQRLAEESCPAVETTAAMHRVNPLFIPRNHLVEAVIQSAIQQQDFQPFEELLDVVLHPFEPSEGRERYAIPAHQDERVTATFCGT